MVFFPISPNNSRFYRFKKSFTKTLSQIKIVESSYMNHELLIGVLNNIGNR